MLFLVKEVTHHFSSGSNNMEEGLYILNGVTLDDVVFEGNNEAWSSLCEAHAEVLSTAGRVSSCAGFSICGVEGCEKEADYYIDFTVTK
jgi:hypothetical protein